MDIFDNLEKESVDQFIIKDTAHIDIISFQDFVYKVENQFFPESALFADNNDYMKWYMRNIIQVPEEEFPHNCMEYLTEENQEDYDNFIKVIEYNFKSALGLTVNPDEYQFKNLYNLYYFFLVKPEELLVDIFLGYHFHKEGYNFKSFYKHRIATNNIPTFDITKNDPVQVVGSFNRQYFIENKNKDLISLSYSEKNSAFMIYAQSIIDNPYEFNFTEIFEIANLYAPCENYEDLDNQIDILYNIRFEDNELITHFIKKNILNIKEREIYVNTKIIDVFFKRIKDFEMSISSSLGY